MNARYKVEPSKSIDAQWEENRKKAYKILAAIKDALQIPATIVKYDLPADLENPETQAEVDSVNEFATHCYDQACELSGIFEDMMCGEQVQKCLDDAQPTESDDQRMREAGLNNGDF